MNLALAVYDDTCTRIKFSHFGVSYLQWTWMQNTCDSRIKILHCYDFLLFEEIDMHVNTQSILYGRNKFVHREGMLGIGIVSCLCWNIKLLLVPFAPPLHVLLKGLGSILMIEFSTLFEIIWRVFAQRSFQWRYQKYFCREHWGDKMRFWGGKNPKICRKWLIFAFFSSNWRESGGRASDRGEGNTPYAPPLWMPPLDLSSFSKSTGCPKSLHLSSSFKKW